MGKYENLVKEILLNIGGKENIKSISHCITRLRFHLEDESKANDDTLKNTKGIISVIRSSGEYQVVIGNHVAQVYEDMCNITGLSNESKSNNNINTITTNKNIFAKLIDIISGCFQPILGPLCASGIIKGLNALLAFIFGATFSESGTYMVLNAIGDAIFYFFPIILGYTAAKKFNLNVIVGMILGSALCYPTIQATTLSSSNVALGTLPFIGDYFSKFVGIPLVAVDYTTTIIPIILIVAFASWIQKYIKKLVPVMIQNFFVPFFVLILSLSIGLLIIGPIVSVLTTLLTQGFSIIYNFSPVICGLIVGFTWQILVIFGLHWAIIPLALLNISNTGYDTILVGQFGTTFALTAVLIAMYLKIKDKEKKSLLIPAIISGICGVTEPAIYGFALPDKKLFILSCIAASIGGGIFTLLGGQQFVIGGLGIFGTVSFISNTGDLTSMYYSFICIAVSATIGFVLTYILWKDKNEYRTNNHLKQRK